MIDEYGFEDEEGGGEEGVDQVDRAVLGQRKSGIRHVRLQPMTDVLEIACDDGEDGAAED
jgi:hypothetical protein